MSCSGSLCNDISFKNSVGAISNPTVVTVGFVVSDGNHVGFEGGNMHHVIVEAIENALIDLVALRCSKISRGPSYQQLSTHTKRCRWLIALLLLLEPIV